jgi:pterin-4a-carbinolamine dehydratase
MVELKTVEDYKLAYSQAIEELKSANESIANLVVKVNFYEEQFANKSRVIVCKKWHQPEITVEYNYAGIRIHTTAENYIKSVVRQAEIDNKPNGWKKYVNWHYPDAEQIESMLLPACKKIEEEMKLTTIHFAPT